LAASQNETSLLLQAQTPGYAVVDLKLNGNTSGLTCVEMQHRYCGRNDQNAHARHVNQDLCCFYFPQRPVPDVGTARHPQIA